MDTPAKDRAASDDDIKRSIEALFKEADGRSVSELLARHNRERLFIRPLLWDHRQPALLQCRFLPCKRAAPPMPRAASLMYDESWYPLFQKDEEDMARSLHHDREPATAYDLLNMRYFVDDGCPDENVKFFYGQRPLCHVGYAVCIALGVCFLDKSTIQSFRNRLVNGPVRACQTPGTVSKARRRFAPPTSMPDPYIAAVCIAVAQSQRLWEAEMEEFRKAEQEDDSSDASETQQLDQDTGSQERFSPAGEAQVTPLVVVVHEGEHLAVFTADVTTAFLTKLDDPRKQPLPGASMDIHQQHVEFHPYKTFAARFAGAVRDTRHRHGPGGQDVGQSGCIGQEGKGSALLCIEQPASTVDNTGVDAAQPNEADKKRKYFNSGTDKQDARSLTLVVKKRLA